MSGSTLENALVSSVGNFLAEVLPSIVSFVLANAELPSDEIVSQLRTEMKLPASSSKAGVLPLAMGSFAGGGALPPPMSGSYPGLVAGVPPPGTGTAGASKPRGPPRKSTKPDQPWLTLAEFFERAGQGVALCAYNPPREPRKNNVCGAVVDPANMEGLTYLQYRCTNCTGKTGKIDQKQTDGAVRAPTAVKGAQVPVSSGLPKTGLPGVPMMRAGLPPRIPPKVPEKPVAKDLVLDEREGYDGLSFSELHPDHVFKQEGDGIVCLGKFKGELEETMPDDFVKTLEPLSSEESALLKDEYSIEFKPRQPSPPKAAARAPLLAKLKMPTLPRKPPASELTLPSGTTETS